MFQLLHDKIPGLNPRAISCDFDRQLFRQWKIVFQGLQLKNIYLVHNVHKQLKRIGLQGLYNGNPNFALRAKMITALCFVSVPHLNTYIDALSANLPLELHFLLNWFEDNYVGGPMRRGTGTRPPLFSPGMWRNQYNRTFAGRDRTNNHAKAAHRKMHTELGVSHPMIWKFIDVLKKIQKARDV